MDKQEQKMNVEVTHDPAIDENNSAPDTSLEVTGIAVFHEGKLYDTNHCGQDASCPLDDGSAAVDDDLPESLKKLVGMQVVSVGDMPCDGCPVDHYGAPCVKVELVGGTLLCLSPLPNSIITE